MHLKECNGRGNGSFLPEADQQLVGEDDWEAKLQKLGNNNKAVLKPVKVGKFLSEETREI